MQLFKGRTDGPVEYEVKADDTLESIAQSQCPDAGGWKALARYNFGSSRARDVLRALVETVGVKVTDLVKVELLANPQKIKLAPDQGLKDDGQTPKLLIPKPFKKDDVAPDSTYVVKVKKIRAAVAIDLVTVSNWFIPEHESCDVEFQLMGDRKAADQLKLEVFGSNYCECTDYAKGLGTYGKPADLVDEAVFSHPAKDAEWKAADLDEQRAYHTPPEAWKGEVTAEKGLLSRKTGKATKRYINVAFSPYTVHLKSWNKAAVADQKARLVLPGFWPRWDATPATPAVTTNDTGGAIEIKWTNAAAIDRGVVEVTDKNGQRVFMAAIEGDKLKSGAQQLDWNKRYRESTLNSRFKKTHSTEDEDKPYTFKVTTETLKPAEKSLWIKWGVKDVTTLKNGLLEVTDGRGRVVFQKPLAAKWVTQKDDHVYKWDGKFAAGVKNSKDGTEVIPEDMPYRVQLSAHTPMNTEKAVALAAMHTEVRLYVRPKTYAPVDILYDPWTSKPSLTLGLGPLVPGKDPEKSARTKWFQHNLAKLGFHPGPVHGKANDEWKIAIKEFKRSVPRKKSGTDYKRLEISEATDIATEAAIEGIEDRYKRRWFGDLTRVLNNSETPDLTDEQIKQALKNPDADMVVWVDDRQYNTKVTAKDENNNDFCAGSPERLAFGLLNYRGDMDVGDAKVTTDASAIPRPWIPLQADMVLVSKDKGLYEEADEVDDTLRDKMRRAIGPLRVDWSFDELPPDFSTIDPATYDTKYSRTRQFVHWAVDDKKAAHTRKDTQRETNYTNCPEDLGGIRGSALADYHKTAFALGENHLAPWEAEGVAKDKVDATDDAPASPAVEAVATVVHDHIAAGQKDDESLFEKQIGLAGTYFNPSRIAGDGYRVMAEVQFDKFGAYDFPNLAPLRARYPTRPQAHGPRMRVWRRSSIRGYMCWAPATGHWPGLITRYRQLYRHAHIYFVHESGAAKTYNVTDVFASGDVTKLARFKNVIANNVTGTLQNKARMTMSDEHIWPWADQDNYGWAKFSPQGVAQNKLYDKWLNKDPINRTWRAYRDGLLVALVKEAERQGELRGHLFVEFKAGPVVEMHEFECAKAPTPHNYWCMTKAGGTAPADGPCKAPGCVENMVDTGFITYNDGLPLPAVGIALGATWLFTSSDSNTWVHEVGHHRHTEHSASAPGAKDAQHDSTNNSTQNWVTLGVAEAEEQHWDRECIMSYSSEANLVFCGKCVLKQRGWKVEGLGGPGAAVVDLT